MVKGNCVKSSPEMPKNGQKFINFLAMVEDKFVKGQDRGTWLAINSGTIELKDNKVIVLAD